jgi:hypothetical protein
MDAFTIATVRMQQLYKKLSSAIAGYKDADSRNHLMDLCIRLKAALDFQKTAFPGVPPVPNSTLGIGRNGLNNASDDSCNFYKTYIPSVEPLPVSRNKSCWQAAE